MSKTPARDEREELEEEEEDRETRERPHEPDERLGQPRREPGAVAVVEQLDLRLSEGVLLASALGCFARVGEEKKYAGEETADAAKSVMRRCL